MTTTKICLKGFGKNATAGSRSIHYRRLALTDSVIEGLKHTVPFHGTYFCPFIRYIGAEAHLVILS